MDNIATDPTQGSRAARSEWHEQLEGAADIHQVLIVSRDYLATFGPEHLARFPADCRPGRIKGEDDIAYWSCRLAQYHHKDPLVPLDAELMQEMPNFFLHPWVRISQMHRPPTPAPMH